MQHLVFALLLVVLPAITCAAGETAPRGKNCELAAPPPSAGEEMNHGITMRIFPRARDIGSQYSGCQTTWYPNGDKWMLISVVVIERGDPVRIYALEAANDPLFACRYRKGKVVTGNTETCAAPEFLIHKSLAPGCVARIRDAAAQGGVSGGFPPGCEYE